MANPHQFAIAKASLTAGLLRADPVSVSRDEIASFHTLLDTSLTICSPSNIQNCKRWVIKNMDTQPRVTALAKYLVALAPAIVDSNTPKGNKMSARRRRLHLLYLVNDLLFHTTRHRPDDKWRDTFKAALSQLFAPAATHRAVKQLAKLERLLGIWEEHTIYPKMFLDELRIVIRDITAGKTAAVAEGEDDGSKGQKKMRLLPALHGDPAIPFYDLPAGNLIPLIQPNSKSAINPRLVKPLQFPTITPKVELVAAVDDFLVSVDKMYNSNGVQPDPDAVGGFGGTADGEGYYGWSKAFCEKMKDRKRDKLEKARSRSATGGARDSARGRRYSSDSYSDRSISRSPSRDRHRRGRFSDHPSRSPSRSRSGSPVRGRSYRDRSKSRSESPRERPAFMQFQRGNEPQANPPSTASNMPSFVPAGGPTSLPPPPPPPPNMQFPIGGAWPPPPPPPPQQGFPAGMDLGQLQQMQQMQQQFQQQWATMPLAMQQALMASMQQQQQGFQPPPPPPPQQQEGQAGMSTDPRTGGYDDYRSVKGREIGAKRGWKT